MSEYPIHCISYDNNNASKGIIIITPPGVIFKTQSNIFMFELRKKQHSRIFSLNYAVNQYLRNKIHYKIKKSVRNLQYSCRALNEGNLPPPKFDAYTRTYPPISVIFGSGGRATAVFCSLLHCGRSQRCLSDVPVSRRVVLFTFNDACSSRKACMFPELKF